MPKFVEVKEVSPKRTFGFSQKPVFSLGRRILKYRFRFPLNFVLGLMGLLVMAFFVIWWDMTRGLVGMVHDGYITDYNTVLQLKKVSFQIASRIAGVLAGVWILAIGFSYFLFRPIYRLEKIFKVRIKK